MSALETSPRRVDGNSGLGQGRGGMHHPCDPRTKFHLVGHDYAASRNLPERRFEETNAPKLSLSLASTECKRSSREGGQEVSYSKVTAFSPLPQKQSRWWERDFSSMSVAIATTQQKKRQHPRNRTATKRGVCVLCTWRSSSLYGVIARSTRTRS
jgi:hypothetical protein